MGSSVLHNGAKSFNKSYLNAQIRKNEKTISLITYKCFPKIQSFTSVREAGGFCEGNSDWNYSRNFLLSVSDKIAITKMKCSKID